jgi:hypothetical protein
MKGSYAPLYKLPPDHHGKATLLQQVRQLLQHQALSSAACQSAGGQDLLGVRIKGFEHAPAQGLAFVPPLCFPAWPGAWVSVFGCCRDLSRFLHPQALYRSKRSAAADVYWVPPRSSFTPLDDTAKRTAGVVDWSWETALRKEAQGWRAQALKEEERGANAERDWVGSRISRAFGTPHGYCSI